MSFAHSGGLFSPAEPDWLTVRQQTTVPSQQTNAPITAVESPVADAPIMAVATPIDVDESAPTQTVAIVPSVQSSAPLSSISPLDRPVLAAVATPSVSPVTSSSGDDHTTNLARSAADPVQIPARRTVADQSLLPPPDVARVTPDPLVDVWFLGVFR